MSATADVLHDAVHFLRSMAHANRVDQKGHQNRIGIELVTEDRQHAQQPDHPDQGAALHDQGAAPAAGEIQQDQRGDAYRCSKEGQHGVETGDQVTHYLGKADDVDVHALGLIARANILEQIGKLLVVERLAGGRIGVEQRHMDDAGAKIQGDQLADLAGQLDVATQHFQIPRRASEAVGHDRPTVEAGLGDPLPAGCRRPQRLHEGTVYAGSQVDFVVDLAQGIHVAGVEDCPLAFHRHGDAQGVGHALELILVGEVIEDERVASRDGLEEACVQAQLGGRYGKHHRQQQAQRDEQRTVVEQDTFKHIARLSVEISQRGDCLEAVGYFTNHDDGP
ncbi:hypothetical protein D9M68_655060 [compost metagenome]